MKALFTVWDGRIAPVCDVAREVLLVEADAGTIVEERAENLSGASRTAKAAQLAGLKPDVLICGAVSRPMRALLAAREIELIPFVAGDARQVVEAWLAGSLDEGSFLMPGCCGRRAGRGSQDGTQGVGRAGQGRGAMGGPLAGGPGGKCLCPQCKHEEPHERGVPCAGKRCPQCGAQMTRA